MNAGNILTSDRMMAVLKALREAGDLGLTTLQISRKTGSMAPGTDVSALRTNGYVVECKYEGRSATGSKIYRYRLLGRRVDA